MVYLSVPPSLGRAAKLYGLGADGAPRGPWAAATARAKAALAGQVPAGALAAAVTGYLANKITNNPLLGLSILAKAAGDDLLIDIAKRAARATSKSSVNITYRKVGAITLPLDPLANNPSALSGSALAYFRRLRALASISVIGQNAPGALATAVSAAFAQRSLPTSKISSYLTANSKRPRALPTSIVGATGDWENNPAFDATDGTGPLDIPDENSDPGKTDVGESMQAVINAVPHIAKALVPVLALFSVQANSAPTAAAVVDVPPPDMPFEEPPRRDAAASPGLARWIVPGAAVGFMALKFIFRR